MNEAYNFYRNAPKNYSLCFRADCPAAAECLRALAARDLTATSPNLPVVNPLLTHPEGGNQCRFFRKAEKVRVAYGFRQALSQLPAGKVRRARMHLRELVTRRNYYYLLNGEKPLYSNMQQKIAAILQANGLTADPAFDRYEWQYDWRK